MEIPEGARLAGTNQVIRAARQNQLICVYLADDADTALRERLLAVCAEHAVEVRRFPSKQELGRRAGIAKHCAVLGIVRA